MKRLECIGLTKNYGSKRALDSVDLTLESGRIVGLLGPNGSGKTTLIKLANGLLCPSSGEILIEGDRPGVVTKEKVSYLSDKNYLPDWMKIRDLLNFFCDFYADFERGRAEEMLKNLDIPENIPLKKMSKGTREKVQLILTMSRQAKVYLLDEAVFLKEGHVVLHKTTDEIREEQGMSVDEYFREVFRC